MYSSRWTGQDNGPTGAEQSPRDALRPRAQGAPNRERFDYGLDTFRLLRAVAHVGCRRGELDRLIAPMTAMDDAAVRRRFARDEILPVRERLARPWEQLPTIQPRVSSAPGELGTVASEGEALRIRAIVLARTPALAGAG